MGIGTTTTQPTWHGGLVGSHLSTTRNSEVAWLAKVCLSQTCPPAKSSSMSGTLSLSMVCSYKTSSIPSTTKPSSGPPIKDFGDLIRIDTTSHDKRRL